MEEEELSLLESLDQWMKCLTARPSLKLKQVLKKLTFSDQFQSGSVSCLHQHVEEVERTRSTAPQKLQLLLVSYQLYFKLCGSPPPPPTPTPHFRFRVSDVKDQKLSVVCTVPGRHYFLCEGC